MKKSTKILIGLGIAAAATTLIAIGVIRELKAIRALTIDEDDLPEELGDEEACDEVVIAE